MSGATFTPTSEWRDVPEEAVLPAGCEIEMDQATGQRRARIAPNGQDHPLDDLVDDLIDDLAEDLDSDYGAQEFDDLPERITRAKALLDGLRKQGKKGKPGRVLTAEAIAAAALLYSWDLPAFSDLKAFLRPTRYWGVGARGEGCGEGSGRAGRER